VLSRSERLSQFLDEIGWADALRRPLAGDASSRRYERLSKATGHSVVLMDAGPEGIETISPFVRLADHLNRIGLSAPEILAADPENGFVLLEDFGDGVFARLMATEPAVEAVLYEAAIDVLVHLHQTKPSDALPAFSPLQLAEFAAITYEWYRLDPEPGGDAVQPFILELKRLLSLVQPDAPVLALRDFHTENMIWLPTRVGVRRVGLLDFQDGFLCHPAYDLASLLRDARRDLSANLVDPLLNRYLKSIGGDPDDLRLAFTIYSAQRNLRIVGVFARLCRLEGKQHYVDLIPRVWNHLLTDLAHPALRTLRAVVLADLPEPKPEFLTRLKARCATVQAP